MATTADSDEFLGSDKPDTDDEIYALYQAACGESYGVYESSDRGGQRFIKGPTGNWLRLANEKAIESFKALIRSRYMDGDGPDSFDPEGWISYRRALAKDD